MNAGTLAAIVQAAETRAATCSCCEATFEQVKLRESWAGYVPGGWVPVDCPHCERLTINAMAARAGDWNTPEPGTGRLRRGVVQERGTWVNDRGAVVRGEPTDREYMQAEREGLQSAD